ncbi:hypothetical protein AB0L06_12350 [Spirillospora sp. NPDC052269]
MSPRIVAGFRPSHLLQPAQRVDGRWDLRYLAELLMLPVEVLGDRNHPRPVWHVPVRAAPEDPILTDEQWAQVAREVMDRSGLAPDGDPDGVRWIAVRHADDHVHLVATLARQDGTRPKVWNDAYRVRSACRSVEERFGLRRTAPADRTAARRPTRGETEKARRIGMPRDARSELRRLVQTAAAGAGSEAAFFAQLQDAGVLLRLRYSERQPDQVTGYAVALRECRTANGEAVWYSGGKLAADLTLPKLRRRWPSGHLAVPGRDLSERTVRAYLRTVLREAAAQARTPAEFFEHLERAGLLLRLRQSETNPGEITGYAVALPDHFGANGRLRWFGGGKLAAELSWTALGRALGSGQPAPPLPELTAEERKAIYQDAARAAEFATTEIRRYMVVDPHRSRDACWAAADILRSAALATGNRHLDEAADAYDRAARAPYGRVPRATPAGMRLRGIARVLAATRAGDGFLVQFVAALVTLIEEIADLHLWHRRQPQADAARSAATLIRRAAPRQPEPRWFVQTKEVPTPAAEIPNPVAVVMAELPHGWQPPLVVSPPAARRPAPAPRRRGPAR